MTVALDHSKTITCPACGGDWPPAKGLFRGTNWINLDEVVFPNPEDTRTHSPAHGGCGASFVVNSDYSLRPMDEKEIMSLSVAERSAMARLIRGDIPE